MGIEQLKVHELVLYAVEKKIDILELEANIAEHPLEALPNKLLEQTPSCIF